jgi:hypothetical protein
MDLENLAHNPEVQSIMAQDNLVLEPPDPNDNTDISGLQPQQAPAFADRPPIDPDRLPDPKNIVDEVAQILKRTRAPEIKELKDNFMAYSAKLESEFPIFSDNYPTLFKKIIKGEDISRLAQYLHMIQKMRTKKISVADGEKELGEALADTYIPKHIRERAAKENAELLNRAQKS